jgi:RHS repeat-associated protein
LISVTLPAVPNPAAGGQRQQPVYTYAYDALGNQTLIRDPLGHETRFTYDDQGHELSRTLPLGFGPDGIQGTSDDSNLPEGAFNETFQYDARGRQILHVSFEGVVTRNIYDTQTGRLKEQDFWASVANYNNGQGTPDEVWTFVYDAFGRQFKVTQAPAVGSASVTSYTYDGEGRVTSITSPQGTVTYTYDNLGRRASTIIGTAQNPLRTLTYAYNALGRLKTVSDKLDATITSGIVLVTAYEYDLLGNLIRTDLPNGAIDVNSFNNINQLTKLIEYGPDSTPNDLSNNPKIAEFDYTLRADGTDRVLAETFWTTAGTLTNTFTWSYDSLNRLISENLTSSDTTRNYTAAYTYDLVGNRVQFQETGAVTETVTSSYDANDRLKQELSTLGTTTIYTYSHTQQASQTVRQADGSTVTTTFTYDLQGNMRTATVDARSSSGTLLSRELLTYGYDATGIRVSALDEIDSNGDGTWDQQTLTEYLNDLQNFTGYSQVLRETHTDSTTGQVTKVIDYTFGRQGIAQTVTPYTNGQPSTPQTNIFGHDGHGSVRVMTDTAAAIAQIYVYDAYGNMLAIYKGDGTFLSSNAANALTTLLYSGQQFDSQIGMQYLRGRYYDPRTGRFGQIDPSLGSIQDPASFEVYVYGFGDPINFGDPSGNYPVSRDLGTEVHNFLTNYFQSVLPPVPTLARFGNRAVSTIGNTLVPGLALNYNDPNPAIRRRNRARPDFVEETTDGSNVGTVTELKHVNLSLNTLADLTNPANAVAIAAATVEAVRDTTWYIGRLGAAVPAYAWGPGITVFPGERPWPGFVATRDAPPAGYTLYTFNLGTPGAILYDFVKLSPPESHRTIDPVDILLLLGLLSYATYDIWNTHRIIQLWQKVNPFVRVGASVNVGQGLQNEATVRAAADSV